MAGSRSATASARFGKYEGVLVKYLSHYQENSYVLCCDYTEVADVYMCVLVKY